MAEAKKDNAPKVQTSLASKGHKTIWHLQKMKEKGEKITMIGTAALDAIFVMYSELGGADLVRYTVPGDTSVARAANTLQQVRNVKKMAPNICTNVFFQPMLYKDKATALENGFAALSEGADTVLLMGASNEMVKHLADNYVAQFGHVGMLSGFQTNWFGGYKKIGKTAEEAMGVFRMAYEYQEAGMRGMTIELTPREVTETVAKKLRIPVVQVAASAPADGSEMVCYDLWGMLPGGGAGTMHAKSYGGAKMADICIKGVAEFKAEIESGAYPAEENGWGMDPAELEKFLSEVEKF